MLFSATSSQKMEDLTQLALKKEPIYVGIEEVVDKATVEGLEQVGGCGHRFVLVEKSLENFSK